MFTLACSFVTDKGPSIFATMRTFDQAHTLRKKNIPEYVLELKSFYDDKHTDPSFPLSLSRSN
jgi:hypothetical protein